MIFSMWFRLVCRRHHLNIAGTVIGAPKWKNRFREGILGLGEFMNFPGVIGADDSVFDKLLVAKEVGKMIDGHGSWNCGNDLNAYAAARILADHECSTVEEMDDRLARGMYLFLRQGSACHNLRPLLHGRNRAEQQKMSSMF